MALIFPEDVDSIDTDLKVKKLLNWLQDNLSDENYCYFNYPFYLSDDLDTIMIVGPEINSMVFFVPNTAYKNLKEIDEIIANELSPVFVCFIKNVLRSSLEQINDLCDELSSLKCYTTDLLKEQIDLECVNFEHQIYIDDIIYSTDRGIETLFNITNTHPPELNYEVFTVLNDKLFDIYNDYFNSDKINTAICSNNNCIFTSNNDRGECPLIVEKSPYDFITKILDHPDLQSEQETGQHVPPGTNPELIEKTDGSLVDELSQDEPINEAIMGVDIYNTQLVPVKILGIIQEGLRLMPGNEIMGIIFEKDTPNDCISEYNHDTNWTTINVSVVVRNARERVENDSNRINAIGLAWWGLCNIVLQEIACSCPEIGMDRQLAWEKSLSVFSQMARSFNVEVPDAIDAELWNSLIEEMIEDIDNQNEDWTQLQAELRQRQIVGIAHDRSWVLDSIREWVRLETGGPDLNHADWFEAVEEIELKPKFVLVNLPSFENGENDTDPSHDQDLQTTDQHQKISPTFSEVTAMSEEVFDKCIDHLEYLGFSKVGNVENAIILRSIDDMLLTVTISNNHILFMHIYDVSKEFNIDNAFDVLLSTVNELNKITVIANYSVTHDEEDNMHRILVKSPYQLVYNKESYSMYIFLLLNEIKSFNDTMNSQLNDIIFKINQEK
jgi:hypothetical protein